MNLGGKLKVSMSFTTREKNSLQKIEINSPLFYKGEREQNVKHSWDCCLKFAKIFYDIFITSFF